MSSLVRYGPPAEWSTTYRCQDCGTIITVADDAQHALDPDWYHTTAECIKSKENSKKFQELRNQSL